MQPVETDDLPGFDLLEIRLKNFLSYGTIETVIPFNQQLIVITGVTGSGKTSILDALTFAIYRRSSRLDISGINIDTVIRAGGYAYVKFKIAAGKIVEVKRGIKTDSTSFVELKVDGKREHGTIPEINDKIISLIGLNYVSFCSSSIIRQDEMKAIGNASSSERLKILQGLFQLDLFNKARDLASEYLNKENQSKDKLSNMIEIEQKEVEKSSELDTQKQAIEEKLKDFNTKISDLERTLSELKLKISNLEKFNEKYSGLKAKLEALKDNQVKNRLKLESAKRSQKIIDESKRNLKLLENETNDIETLKDEKVDLEKKDEKVNVMRNQMRQYADDLNEIRTSKKNKIDQIDIDIKELELRKKSIQTDIDSLEAFRLLRSEGRIIERTKRIPKEIEWLQGKADITLIKNLEEEFKESRIKLKELNELTNRINKDSFVLSELNKQIEDLNRKKEEEIINFDKQIQETKLKVIEIQKNIISIFSEKDENRLVELRELVQKKEKKKRELEAARAEIEKEGDYTNLIKGLVTEMSSLDTSTIQIKNDIKEIIPFIEEFNSFSVQVDQEEKQYNYLKIEMAKLERDYQHTEDEIKKIRNLTIELQNNLTEQNKIVEQIEILTQIYDNIFHIKGVSLYAIKKILPRISKKASMILSELTDKRYTSVILEEKQIVESKKKASYGFDILIGAPMGLRDVATFSGGEKTQINAALRLAISEELAIIPRPNMTKMKTLFIDEGDIGQLDTWKSRDDFVKKLFGLTKIFNKIIFITHIEEIANLFPNRIEIRINSQGQSNIVIYNS